MKNIILKIKYKIIFILLITIILPIATTPISYGTNIPDKYSDEDILKVIEEVIEWRKDKEGIDKSKPLLNNKFLENAGKSLVDWYPIGIGRIGVIDDYDSYLYVISDKVSKAYTKEDKLSRTKATEWHRISLASLSMGGDPTSLGKDLNGNPINLIADGTYNRGKTRSLGDQGINGWIWGLITLDSMRYIVPEDGFYTRDDIIVEIISKQLEDGGFSLNDGETDPDITGMVIQALAPYYNSEQEYTYIKELTKEKATKTVREVVDEALDLLGEIQLKDGDFMSWNAENLESTAQVLTALTALGKDPLNDERFIKGDKNLLDGIMKYKMDNGGFMHSKTYDSENPTAIPDESNSMASEQALYSLVSLVRYNGGYRSLYDFRSEMDGDLKKKINGITGDIGKLPKKISSKDIKEINRIFKEYLEIPISERSYIYNYYKLSDAMELMDIENTSEAIASNMGVNKNGTGTITPIIDKNQELDVNVLFTEEDVEKINTIPNELTTEYYIEVVKLIEKLETAENRDEFDHLLKDLSSKKKEIEKIKLEIDSLNNEILEKLYPFSDISIKDKENVEDIVERFNKLSPYDQKQILRYEDVIKSKTQIDNLTRARKIYIGITIIVLILIITMIMRKKKERKKKKINKT